MVVPAWKKLGLKLKQPAASSDPPSTTTTTTTTTTATTTPSAATPAQAPLKRRLETPPAQAVAKKPRKAEPPTQPKPKKSVSFHDTPSSKPLPSKTAPKKQKKQKKNPAAAAAAAPPSIAPALDYLRQWHSARASWKFNKNHQTALIKHAFDPDVLPASDVATFYAYIRDLKGFTRSRLRDAAAELRAEDSTKGAAGFPEGTADVADKQLAYEAVLARVLHAQVGKQRKEFDEVKYRAEAAEDDKGGEEVVRRAVRRMRAQLVMDELAGDGDAAPATATVVVTDLKKPGVKNEVAGKRRRKLRVNVDSDSSSSEESDSDTSGDDSSSDDEDEGDKKEVKKKEAKTTKAKTETKKSSAAKEESDEDSSSSSDSSSDDSSDEE